MKIYITREQQQSLAYLIALQEPKYQKTEHGGFASINENVFIRFQNHKPVSFRYQTTELGKVKMEMDNDFNVEWNIDSSNKYDGNFDLEYNQQTAKVTLDF